MRRPGLRRSPSSFVNGFQRASEPSPPVTAPPVICGYYPLPTHVEAVLELGDGSTYRGTSFGAEGKSIAGECVFQTGELHTFVTRVRY